GDPVTLRTAIRHLTPIDPSWSPRGGRRRSRRASEVGEGSTAPRSAAAPALSGRLQRAAVGAAVAVQGGGGGRAEAARLHAFLPLRPSAAEGGWAQLSPTIQPSSRLIVRWPYAALASE